MGQTYWHKGIEIWYSRERRLWCIWNRTTISTYANIEVLMRDHPEFAHIEGLKLVLTRRLEKKARNQEVKNDIAGVKTVVKFPEKRIVEDGKLVTCYYCSGSGRVGYGLPCPECKGKGDYMVTTKGF